MLEPLCWFGNIEFFFVSESIVQYDFQTVHEFARVVAMMCYVVEKHTIPRNIVICIPSPFHAVNLCPTAHNFQQRARGARPRSFARQKPKYDSLVCNTALSRGLRPHTTGYRGENLRKNASQLLSISWVHAFSRWLDVCNFRLRISRFSVYFCTIYSRLRIAVYVLGRCRWLSTSRNNFFFFFFIEIVR